MPLKIRVHTYKWLQSLGILKNQIIVSPQVGAMCEISFDEQNYFRNGYLISVLLRKFVETYGQEYQDLLRVRKITTLKESQNWQIIEQHLLRIGCDILDSSQDDVGISECDIEGIIEFIMDKFGPEELKKKYLEKGRKKHLDYNNFSSQKPLEQAQNSLQLMCILLARAFALPLSQVLGLLVDNSGYLKKLMVDGSNSNQFQSVITFVQLVIQNWQLIQSKFISKKDLYYVLQGISEGVLSQNNDVSKLTLSLYSMVDSPEWFHKTGYIKLLQSPRIQCFNFAVQKVKPAYELVFNQRLHEKIVDKAQLFLLFRNLISILPKTIYCRDILVQMPIEYLCQQIFMVMGGDEIDSQPIKVIVQGRQLLTTLISTFPHKIPSYVLPQILELFSYQGSRLYWDQFHILSQLFQIIQGLMKKENPLIAHFFKIAMKYFQNTFGEIRHWIIENLGSLYAQHKGYFPLSCFLKMYSTSHISQADQYTIFQTLVSDENMEEQQIEIALNIMNYYIEHQIHAKCFIKLMQQLLRKYGKMAINWGQKTYEKTISHIEKMKVPMLDDNNHIHNPVKPNRNKVVQSIGIKRKQMLKFRDFQLQRQILYLLLHLKNKHFLQKYWHFINVNLNRLQHEIGVKKKSLIDLYKNIKQRIKAQEAAIVDGPNMDQLVKSVIMTKSMMQPVLNRQKQPKQQIMAESMLNSEWEPAQSHFTNTQYNPVIREEQVENESGDQNNQNQFLTQGDFDRQFMDKQQQSPLLPFTDNIEQSHPIFYSDSILQQHQIAHIKMMKQKYDHIILYCTHLYEEIAEKTKQMDERMWELLKAMKLETIVNKSDTEQLFIKSNLSETQNSCIIANFIVQLAFAVFGFKKVRRIAVNCVQSMFVYLKELFSASIQTSVLGSERKSENLVDKKMVYEPKISKKIMSNNQKPYLMCLNVVNDIFCSALGLNLIQPISKQVSSYFDDGNEENGDDDDGKLEQQMMKQNERQLRSDNKEKKLRFRKLEPKKQQLEEKSQSRLTKNVDNKLLKSRIEERMKNLQKQLAKKKNDPMHT